MSNVTRRADKCTAGLPALRSRDQGRQTSYQGMSLIELMLVLVIVLVSAGMAIPALLATRNEWVARSATRYLLSQLMLARSQAARYGAAVGLRFEEVAGEMRFTSYVDGDGDGVRQADIAEGIDESVDPARALGDQYPGVRFGLAGAVPAVGGGAPISGSDPVRLGTGDILTFSPVGTATSGTIYVAGPDQQQYAIRVLGTTGRLRVLRFDRVSGRWEKK